jgi:uncharacterized OsmC-like protein
MKITARVSNSKFTQTVDVATDGRQQAIAIGARTDRPGSSVNGGELLFAALATCVCNDLYREAARRGITVDGVEVEVTGSFGGPGEPARDIEYRVNVQSDADRDTIDELITATDSVTEVQNTLRRGCAVRLVRAQVHDEGDGAHPTGAGSARTAGD